MKYLTLFLSCFFLLIATPTLAQPMVTTRQLTVIDDDKASLNSDKKDKLSMSVSGRAFSGAFFLPAGTPVKILSRQTYTKHETVGHKANPIKRQFTAGVIEVLDGEHAGKRGWAVIDVQDPGQRKDVLIRAGGPERPGNTPTSGQLEVDPSAPDLVPGGFGKTGVPLAGKKVYSASVVNQGQSEAKGAFDVTVKVNGRVVKTEKVRNLSAGGSHTFHFEVSEAHLRNNAKIEIMVDSGNSIKEGNESNNLTSSSL